MTATDHRRHGRSRLAPTSSCGDTPGTESRSEVELRQYARLLNRYRVLIALTALLGALIGFGMTVTRPDQYESSTLVGAVGAGQGTSADEAYVEQLLAQGSIETYAALASSPVTLEAAAQTLGNTTAEELHA